MKVRSVAYVDKEPRLGIRRLGLGGLLRRTPSPQSNSATHSQVQDVVELARKCTGEFLTLPDRNLPSL